MSYPFGLSRYSIASYQFLQTLRRQPRYFDDRPDFDGPLASHRNPCSDGDGLIEILGLNEEVTAQLFARLRERAVGHEPFAVAHPDAGRHRRGVQRVGGHILPVRMKLMRELRGLRITVLPLGFTQAILVTVNQQHVFHVEASISSRSCDFAAFTAGILTSDPLRSCNRIPRIAAYPYIGRGGAPMSCPRPVPRRGPWT